MNRIQIIIFLSMVFKAKPTELMPTWTRHVWATWYFLNWYLTFWTFVCQKYEVYETEYWFQSKTLWCCQRSLTFWTVMTGVPFAFGSCVYEITVLRGTFANILRESCVFFEKELFKFFVMFLFQPIQSNADINIVLWLKWRDYAWANIVGHFFNMSFDMHVPTLVAC